MEAVLQVGLGASLGLRDRFVRGRVTSGHISPLVFTFRVIPSKNDSALDRHHALQALVLRGKADFRLRSSNFRLHSLPGMQFSHLTCPHLVLLLPQALMLRGRRTFAQTHNRESFLTLASLTLFQQPKPSCRR